jgi:hypothetical protein
MRTLCRPADALSLLIAATLLGTALACSKAPESAGR